MLMIVMGVFVIMNFCVWYRWCLLGRCGYDLLLFFVFFVCFGVVCCFCVGLVELYLFGGFFCYYWCLYG